MTGPKRQRGVALFTVVFLIVVVGLLAITVGLISGQQQLTSAQTLDQTRALYAARAQLEEEIAAALNGGSCPAEDIDGFSGFETELLSCQRVSVQEGGNAYEVYSLEVRARRGNQRSGTLVQRRVRAQVVDDGS